MSFSKGDSGDGGRGTALAIGVWEDHERPLMDREGPERDRFENSNFEEEGVGSTVSLSRLFGLPLGDGVFDEDGTIVRLIGNGARRQVPS